MSRFGLNSYINAILELGKETNQLNLFIELSNNLLSVIESEPLFLKFLGDSSVELEEKKLTFKKAFKEKEADFFIKWLLILISDHVIGELKYILEEVILSYNKEQGIANGIIWTTVLLKTQQINKINLLVSKNINLKTNLVNKIDQELLGGIKIEVAGKVWDNSINEKIKKLTYQLLMKDRNG